MLNGTKDSLDLLTMNRKLISVESLWSSQSCACLCANGKNQVSICSLSSTEVWYWQCGANPNHQQNVRRKCGTNRNHQQCVWRKHGSSKWKPRLWFERSVFLWGYGNWWWYRWNGTKLYQPRHRRRNKCFHFCTISCVQEQWRRNSSTTTIRSRNSTR